MPGLRAALILAAALAASACGNADGLDATAPSPAASPAGGVADPRLLSALVAPGDYEPTAGPAELRDMVDVVVDATVSGVADGQEIGARDDGPRHHLVLTLTPTAVYKAPRDAGPIHLQLRRPDNISAASYRAAIPDGTRLLVFAYQTREQREEPVRNRFGGRSEGSPLLVAAPQGFCIAASGDATRGLIHPDLGCGWGELDTFDEITAALQ